MTKFKAKSPFKSLEAAVMYAPIGTSSRINERE